MLKNQLDLVPISEAMELLDVSRSTIDRWRKSKQLPSVKIGKEIYFDKHEMLHWYKEFSKMRHSASDEDADEVLTIGYTTVAAHMWSPLVIQEFGLLEDELRRVRPNERIQIKWHKAKDGMELVKELVSGNIQLATLGDYALSVSHMISRLLPDFRPILLAAGGKSTNGDGFGLVVPPTWTFHSLSELATLPIATTFRTNAEYRLRKLLEKHSLPELNIIHRSIEESITSLRQGRLSASIMWEPFLSLVQHRKLGKPIFHKELGLGFLAGVVADGGWAQEHEDLAIAYMKAHLLASRMIREQPLRAAKAVAKEIGFPAEVTSLALSRIRWDAALYENDLKVFDYFGPSDVRDGAASPLIDTKIQYNIRYLRIAAQELKLPALPPSPIAGSWQEEIHY
ncbi:helix-turn-helix domain-containing protein [Paenibacillaceae bacterium WGS1546]|uniref:helix-turn-helix domain-containing protein n=1 Tax=Cohnella sp. WGS1546 TaxID=3366810 RepID=UPI00372D4E6B